MYLCVSRRRDNNNINNGGSLTRLLSKASALCSSFCLKQLVHLDLLNMLGENFLHSPLRVMGPTVIGNPRERTLRRRPGNRKFRALRHRRT